eukprot:12598417-Alexandrium_andersonii.AAC.1
MVADHVVSLAAMVRAIPSAHAARRAVEWGGEHDALVGALHGRPIRHTHTHALTCKCVVSHARA